MIVLQVFAILSGMVLSFVGLAGLLAPGESANIALASQPAWVHWVFCDHADFVAFLGVLVGGLGCSWEWIRTMWRRYQPVDDPTVDVADAASM